MEHQTVSFNWFHGLIWVGAIIAAVANASDRVNDSKYSFYSLSGRVAVSEVTGAELQQHIELDTQ